MKKAVNKSVSECQEIGIRTAFLQSFRVRSNREGDDGAMQGSAGIQKLHTRLCLHDQYSSFFLVVLHLLLTPALIVAALSRTANFLTLWETAPNSLRDCSFYRFLSMLCNLGLSDF